MRLIILGAGPKAVAIAAKVAVLRELRYSVPEVVVIDKVGVAANWEGSQGFTDGLHPLGTSPGKDVGFPYQSEFAGVVDQHMLAYSWQAFLVDQGLYSEWVDRGSPQPPHGRWSAYLNWVAGKVNLRVLVGEVIRITDRGHSWLVTYRTKGGSRSRVEGDGLVVTGPGEPSRLPGQPLKHDRVYDGKTFWENLDVFRGLRDVSVGVVGGGETAAQVVLGLLDNVDKRTVNIAIINRHGAIFSRGESYDENRRFSDPSGWSEIPVPDRRELIDRTDRGVFSLHSKRILDHAENVRHWMAHVEGIMMSGDQPFLMGRLGAKKVLFDLDYLINALGFEPLWFKKLMTRPPGGLLSNKAAVEKGIAYDLSVKGVYPKLHLPMLAGVAQGPGFPNLSCLSIVSDRILKAYVGAPGKLGNKRVVL